MQLVYIPYLAMNNVDEIDIGNVKVWNFSKSASTYISDTQIRRHVRRIVRSNICRGKIIDDAGIIAIGTIDFRALPAEELNAVYEASLILFLACLSHNVTSLRSANAGHFMMTSENFDIVRQNFVPGNLDIAETAGYIVTGLHGGFKLGKKKFYAPTCLIRPLNFNPDKELINGVLKLRYKKGSKKLFKRIIYSADLFRQSYYNHDNVSIQSRILLQMAAFEVLLDIAKRDQRKDFKNKIEKYCSLQNERRYVHYYVSHGRKMLDSSRNYKGKWADAFYSLRNRIIHGDNVAQREFVYRKSARHIDIATMFFILVIKKIINEILNDKIFYDEIRWWPKDMGTTTKRGFEYSDNRIYKALVQQQSIARKIK
jgi:hypothetical protein